MIEGRCHARVAVAACHNFRVWPNFETDLLERAAIFLRSATGKKNSRAIDLPGQFSEDFAQTLRRGQAQIGWRQFSLVDDAKFRAGRIGDFYKHPGGFRATAFEAKDALAGFHVFRL
jgi:hypothetical protein